MKTIVLAVAVVLSTLVLVGTSLGTLVHTVHKLFRSSVFRTRNSSVYA